MRGKHAAALTLLVGLWACVAPMTSREAQQIAANRVENYCDGHCGTLVPGRTQRIKNRWLVDIDAPTRKFTVIVENNGNSRLNIWEKQAE